MSRGQHVFSPITHSHPIAQVGHLPVEWDYWEAYDKRLLAICDQLYVVDEVVSEEFRRRIRGGCRAK